MDRITTPDDFVFQLTYGMASPADRRRYDDAVARLADARKPQVRMTQSSSRGGSRERGITGSRGGSAEGYLQQGKGGKPGTRTTRALEARPRTDVRRLVLAKEWNGKFDPEQVAGAVMKSLDEVKAEAKVMDLNAYVEKLDDYTRKLVVNEVYNKAVRMLKHKMRRQR